jgi:ethanolamine utilization protein EutN
LFNDIPARSGPLMANFQVPDGDLSRFRPGADTVVAVDTVGAGVGELVVICQGSSARLAPDLKEAPVDAVVMGIVDVVDLLGQQVYSSET